MSDIPKHIAFFKLEASTTERMSEEKFLKMVAQKMLTMEMLLNEDMHFRFHIHDDTKANRKVKNDTNKTGK